MQMIYAMINAMLMQMIDAMINASTRTQTFPSTPKQSQYYHVTWQRIFI